MRDENIFSGEKKGGAQPLRVVVAMSGGVDSSVAAALMQQEGHEVIGVTLHLYQSSSKSRKGACCAGKDVHDARRVASRLGVPHYVLDYEARFKESVINPFVESYLAGETPVPCVACNQSVKFEDLLSVARELEADALVTGHYIESRLLSNGKRGMFRPLDSTRDQSYFLFATTQEQLNFLHFPLGNIEKTETRRLARMFELDLADKPDSQDICFVSQGRYSEFVQKMRPDAAKPGLLKHVDGRVLGAHDGVHRFTVGQRRGLGVITGEPLYVVRLDPDTASVIVGPRESLLKKSFYLRQMNWLGDQPLTEMMTNAQRVAVRVRSARAPRAAHLTLDGAYVVVNMEEGEEGVAPGQACVIYENDAPRSRVLGGGVITRSPSSETEVATL